MCDEEKEARQREASAARERLEALRDELSAEGARAREGEWEKRMALHRELEKERSLRCEAEMAAARRVVEPAPPVISAEERRGESEAELREKVRGLEDVSRVLRLELSERGEERRKVLALQKEVEEMRRRGRAHDALSADVDQLRRELAAADRQQQAGLDHTTNLISNQHSQHHHHHRHPPPLTYSCTLVLSTLHAQHPHQAMSRAGCLVVAGAGAAKRPA